MHTCNPSAVGLETGSLKLAAISFAPGTVRQSVFMDWGVIEQDTWQPPLSSTQSCKAHVCVPSPSPTQTQTRGHIDIHRQTHTHKPQTHTDTRGGV